MWWEGFSFQKMKSGRGLGGGKMNYVKGFPGKALHNPLFRKSLSKSQLPTIEILFLTHFPTP